MGGRGGPRGARRANLPQPQPGRGDTCPPPSEAARPSRFSACGEGSSTSARPSPAGREARELAARARPARPLRQIPQLAPSAANGRRPAHPRGRAAGLQARGAWRPRGKPARAAVAAQAGSPGRAAAPPSNAAVAPLPRAPRLWAPQPCRALGPVPPAIGGSAGKRCGTVKGSPVDRAIGRKGPRPGEGPQASAPKVGKRQEGRPSPSRPEGHPQAGTVQQQHSAIRRWAPLGRPSRPPREGWPGVAPVSREQSRPPFWAAPAGKGLPLEGPGCFRGHCPTSVPSSTQSRPEQIGEFEGKYSPKISGCLQENLLPPPEEGSGASSTSRERVLALITTAEAWL